ncbi:MAG TPA: iron ABC transporter permease [Methylomirabilota bacterium]|nr:iron ABC transporter permease [Methylomirabilota bacterium]
MITRRRVLLTTGAVALALAAVSLGALALGAARLSPAEVVATLLGRQVSELATTVVLGLRLPRILLAALAGMGLAVAGVGFQAVTRNPLADPAVLGVASGAALGAVLGQIAGLEGSLLAAFGLSAAAFLGALVAASAVYLIASVGGRLPIQTLLLAGVIIGLFFSAAITLIISLADFARLGGILHWLMGSLGAAGYRPVVVMALGCAAGIGAIYAQARALNLLALGEEPALQLGVEAERVKRVIFVAASLLTGVIVAHTGPIGFVGLIVPHAVRLTVGSDNRLLIPAAAGVGGAFLVLADTLARVVARPAELPVGVITAFCGAPFFIYLLRTRLRERLG